MSKKILETLMILFILILTGASCQGPAEGIKEMKELSEITPSQAEQVLRQTAMELGWGVHQVRTTAEYFPVDLLVNEFHTMRIDNKNDGSLVSIEKQYKLPGELNPATFSQEYCDMRAGMGHMTNMVDIEGYPACNIVSVGEIIGGTYLFAGQYLVRYDNSDRFTKGMTDNVQVATSIVNKLLSVTK